MIDPNAKADIKSFAWFAPLNPYEVITFEINIRVLARLQYSSGTLPR
jgi:hypothetical protein